MEYLTSPSSISFLYILCLKALPFSLKYFISSFSILYFNKFLSKMESTILEEITRQQKGILNGLYMLSIFFLPQWRSNQSYNVWNKMNTREHTHIKWQKYHVFSFVVPRLHIVMPNHICTHCLEVEAKLTRETQGPNVKDGGDKRGQDYVQDQSTLFIYVKYFYVTQF